MIDRFSRFDGDFVAERDLRVEGNVKGSIDCNGTLFVAEGAIVSAKVTAENITVAGDLSGETRCRGKLHLLPTGRVRGRVSTAGLVITEGAIYEGELAMAEDAHAETAPQRPTVVPAPSVAPRAESTATARRTGRRAQHLHSPSWRPRNAMGCRARVRLRQFLSATSAGLDSLYAGNRLLAGAVQT